MALFESRTYLTSAQKKKGTHGTLAISTLIGGIKFKATKEGKEKNPGDYKSSSCIGILTVRTIFKFKNDFTLISHK